MRIAVIGSPRAGKTTLAAELAEQHSLPIFHADDFIALGWSAASEALAARMSADVPCIYEGVMVVRALRKALCQRADAPVDRCVVLDRPRVQLTVGQAAMRRGCATVLAHIEPELRRRGVEMVRM